MSTEQEPLLAAKQSPSDNTTTAGEGGEEAPLPRDKSFGSCGQALAAYVASGKPQENLRNKELDGGDSEQDADDALVPVVVGQPVLSRSERWKKRYQFLKPGLIIFYFSFSSAVNQAFVSPLIPFLLKDYYDGDIKKAASIQTTFDAVRAFVACLLVPVYGSLLDTWGRKPFFVIQAILSIMPYAFLYAVPSNPLIYLTLHQLSQVQGAGYLLAMSNDCYFERHRAMMFAVVDGLAASGILIGMIGAFIPLETLALIPLVIALLRLPFALFVVEETLPKDQRKPFSLKLLRGSLSNPLRSLKLVVQNRVMAACTVTCGCILIMSSGTQDIAAYYFMSRVPWTAADNYLVTMETGALVPVMLLLVYPCAARLLAPTTLVSGSMVMLMSVCVLAPFVFWKWIIFYVMVPLAIAVVVGLPSLIGIFSNAGEQNNQGQRLAGLTAFMDLVQAFTPLGMGQMFSALPTKINWLPYVISAVCAIPGLVISSCFLRRWMEKDKRETLALSFTSEAGRAYAAAAAAAAAEDAERRSQGRISRASSIIILNDDGHRDAETEEETP